MYLGPITYLALRIWTEPNTPNRKFGFRFTLGLVQKAFENILVFQFSSVFDEFGFQKQNKINQNY